MAHILLGKVFSLGVLANQIYRGQSISLHSVLAIAPIPHLRGGPEHKHITSRRTQTYLSQLKALLFESLHETLHGYLESGLSSQARGHATWLRLRGNFLPVASSFMFFIILH